MILKPSATIEVDFATERLKKLISECHYTDSAFSLANTSAVNPKIKGGIIWG